MHNNSPIGVFDSGFGGLTILKDIKRELPQYDYIYLGDNARAPYGNRSFETVYEYTLQAVKWFFSKGCNLVILACNTASAKALRSIQQKDLQLLDSDKRVLGVIRPTSEIIGNFSGSKNIGILGTSGTINSCSYLIEIEKFYPKINLFQHSCPMWVPLIENNEYQNEGADYFIKKDLNLLMEQSPDIDTILLACTHYPLLIEKIRSFIPDNIKIVSQGPIIAASLKDYLQRHIKIKNSLSQNAGIQFFTTDAPEVFDNQAVTFFDQLVSSCHVDIN
ncbi:MAG: glutamate racemase [Ginsengibacter sp.]